MAGRRLADVIFADIVTERSMISRTTASSGSLGGHRNHWLSYAWLFLTSYCPKSQSKRLLDEQYGVL